MAIPIYIGFNTDPNGNPNPRAVAPVVPGTSSQSPLPPEVTQHVQAMQRADDAATATQTAVKQDANLNTVVQGDQLDPDLQAAVNVQKGATTTSNVSQASLLSQALDVPVQVAGGFLDAADATAGLGIDVSNEIAKGVVSQLPNNDTTGMDERAAAMKPHLGGLVPEANNTVSGISRPVAQFLAPFAALGKLRYLSGLEEAAPWAQSLLKGATTDFVAFDEHQKRLSNLINDVGWGNAVTEYLASKPEDGFAEGRLKNAIEGSVPGIMADALFKGIRYIKNGTDARAATADLRKTMQSTSSAAVGKLQTMQQQLATFKAGGDATAMPAADATAPAAAAGVGSTPKVSGRAPLQLGETDRDTAIRTIFGEASNQGEAGWQAVANVLLNRQSAGTFGANLDKIAKAKNQFEPWGNTGARSRMEALDPTSKEYKAIGDVLDRVASGELPDNTNGATHFLQRKLQLALGRSIPKWAQDPTATIGDHQFFSPGKVGAPRAPASDSTLAGLTPSAKATTPVVPRPNKQALSLEAQEALARATGLTTEDLTSGKLFNQLHATGAQDMANQATLLQVDTMKETSELAQQAISRGQQLGDMDAAADEFLRTQGAAMLAVTGHAQDVVQEAARAMGFRGNQPEIVAANQLMRGLNNASSMTKSDMLQFFANVTNPEQVDAAVKQMQGRDWGTLTRETLFSWMYHGLLSGKAVLNDAWGTAAQLPLNLVNKQVAAGIGGLRTTGAKALGLEYNPDRVRMTEAAMDVHSYFQSMLDSFAVLAKAAQMPDMGAAGSYARNVVAPGASAVERMDAAGNVIKATLPFNGKVISEAYDSTKLDLNRAQMQKAGKQVISAANYGVEDSTVLARLIDFVGNVVHAPMNIMRTKDTLTKYMLINADARSMAYRRAAAEGLTGDALRERSNEIWQAVMDKSKFSETTLDGNRLNKIANELENGGSSTDLIADSIRGQAVQSARQSTLTDEFGPTAAAWKQAIDSTPGGRIVVPFFQTVGKTISRVMEQTPGIAFAMRNVREDMAAGGARRDMALARQGTGAALFGLGWYLSNAGVITGSNPSNADQGAMQKGTKWLPNAVRIANEYVDLSPIQPLASFLTMPANMVQLMAEHNNDLGDKLEKDMGDYAGMVALAGMKTIMGTSWMQPVARILDAVNTQNATSLKRIIDETAASLAVPASVAYVAREINPIVQDANGLFESIKARAGVNVRPQLDYLGEPVKNYDQMTGLFPGRNSANTPQDKLTQTLLANGIVIAKPSNEIRDVQIDKDTYNKVLTAMKDMGVREKLDNFVNSPVFNGLPDTARSDVQGATNMTKSGVIQNLYDTMAHNAKEQVLQNDVSLQQRIFKYENNLRTMRKVVPGADTMLKAQGFSGPVSQGQTLRVDFGLGQNNGNQ